MMKVAARGVAIDLGHLSLSTGSSKVTWNNRHRHLYHAFPQYEYASVTVLHTEITLLLRRRIMSTGTGFFIVSVTVASEFQFRN